MKQKRKWKTKVLTKKKQLENELVKIKHAKNPTKLHSELKRLNEIQVAD